MACPLARRAATVILVAAVAGCASSPPSRPSPAPSPAVEIAAPPPVEAEPVAESEAPAPEPPAATGPGWLGVELREVPEGQPGVLIRRVVRGGPGEVAGLAQGDRILQIDGETVSQPADVVRLVRQHRAGERLNIAYRRGKQDRLVAAMLEPIPSADQILRQNYVGAPAPHFSSLTAVQGSLAPGLDALKGKVAVLEFWASWCGVCPIMVPTMNDWYSRFGAQGFEVVGVTTDAVGVAAASAAQQGMSYPIWSDETGRTTEIYRALSLPTLFVIDRNGVVRDVLVGYSSSRLAELEQLVGRLLAQR